MRWICSQCRRPVSLALTECPFCRAAAAGLPASGGERKVLPQPPLTVPTGFQAPAEIAAVMPPTQPSPLPPAHVVTAPKERHVIQKPTAAIEQQLCPLPAEPSESPLYRGFRLGLGFALALATVLLLLAVLLVWLRGTPWLDWLRH